MIDARIVDPRNNLFTLAAPPAPRTTTLHPVVAVRDWTTTVGAAYGGTCSAHSTRATVGQIALQRAHSR